MHSRISASHAREWEEESNRGKRRRMKPTRPNCDTLSAYLQHCRLKEEVSHCFSLSLSVRCSLAPCGKLLVRFPWSEHLIFFFPPAVLLPFPSAPCGNQLNEPFDSELQAGGWLDSSSSFAVYISMEHPGSASKAIFELGWVKLFSVGITEEGLTYSQRAEWNIFHTVPQLLKSIVVLTGVTSGTRGVPTRSHCDSRLFFFPAHSPIPPQFPLWQVQHNLAVLQCYRSAGGFRDTIVHHHKPRT